MRSVWCLRQISCSVSASAGDAGDKSSAQYIADLLGEPARHPHLLVWLLVLEVFRDLMRFSPWERSPSNTLCGKQALSAQNKDLSLYCQAMYCLPISKSSTLNSSRKKESCSAAKERPGLTLCKQAQYTGTIEPSHAMYCLHSHEETRMLGSIVQAPTSSQCTEQRHSHAMYCCDEQLWWLNSNQNQNKDTKPSFQKTCKILRKQCLEYSCWVPLYRNN